MNIFFRGCNKILDNFSNKWHPQSKRLVYLSTFSTENWKRLTNSEKEKHTLAFCGACFNSYQTLQECFPGKPVFFPPEPMISLPDTPCTIRAEKNMTRKVLGELNSFWEEKYNHSFTSELPRNAPEAGLAPKVTSKERKKQDCSQK